MNDEDQIERHEVSENFERIEKLTLVIKLGFGVDLGMAGGVAEGGSWKSTGFDKLASRRFWKD